MAFQFSTRTMLLATACIAVVLACLIAWLRVMVPIGHTDPATTLAVLVAMTVPAWNPLVWAAYAIGRRQLTTAFVVVFAIFEVVLTTAVIWMSNQL